MAKIRHISLNGEDPRALAEFYKQTFGMQELKLGAEGSPAIYLSDGYIQFVILPARGQHEGIDHFGFEVESVDGAVTAAETAAGEAWHGARTTPGQYAALRIHDPVGTGIDLGTRWDA
ncbi:MAG TPA: VOC family protein [Chloroflexota bacterium]|jgi:catechol 2,3-dioxygenase-like lactoylglutathione lyase family enzyme